MIRIVAGEALIHLVLLGFCTVPAEEGEAELALHHLVLLGELFFPGFRLLSMQPNLMFCLPKREQER